MVLPRARPRPKLLRLSLHPSLRVGGWTWPVRVRETSRPFVRASRNIGGGRYIMIRRFRLPPLGVARAQWRSLQMLRGRPHAAMPPAFPQSSRQARHQVVRNEGWNSRRTPIKSRRANCSYLVISSYGRLVPLTTHHHNEPKITLLVVQIIIINTICCVTHRNYALSGSTSVP
jgi:hypothetical protein